MADITIDNSIYTVAHTTNLRGGIYWTSHIIGYSIYIDGTSVLQYCKTTDGGQNWGTPTNIISLAGTGNPTYDTYADWEVPNDSGTKIHIIVMNKGSSVFQYLYFDTATDTASSPDTVESCQGTGTFYASTSWSLRYCTITKSVGGNICIALRYVDSDATRFTSFYTSPDGTTWASKSAVMEDVNDDTALLFPANLTDTNDIWCLYQDGSSDEVSLKTFDFSGDSWSEQVLGTNAENGSYINMSGSIRHSDGHLIVASWTAFNSATADLLVWDIENASSITAKTNVITNTAEYALSNVFIDQTTDDIYVSYVGGTDMTSAVSVLYKKSTDGGANWGSETGFSVDAEADLRWISHGGISSLTGGRFMPIWFNDDNNDLITNYTNSVDITAVVPSIPAELTVNPLITATITDVIPAVLSCEAAITASWTETYAAVLSCEPLIVAGYPFGAVLLVEAKISAVTSDNKQTATSTGNLPTYTTGRFGLDDETLVLRGR